MKEEEENENRHEEKGEKEKEIHTRQNLTASAEVPRRASAAVPRRGDGTSVREFSQEGKNEKALYL